MLDDARFRSLIENRARHPERIAERARARQRRPLLGDAGSLFLIAADHAARGVLKAGDRALAGHVSDLLGDFDHRLLGLVRLHGRDDVEGTRPAR